MKSIVIGKSEAGDVKLDIGRLIATRALISADSGGGKSYLLRRIIEEVSATTQTIVIDPEGEFSTLREIRDMVLVGPDGEVPADPVSAGVLCRKLMEMNLSAVIDLSELSLRDRQAFVEKFCNTMVSLPKELWRRCFVFVDEAHDVAPEGEKCASEEAMASLSSKGRKRGYCLIPATQRLSKLSKNVAAGLKNQCLGTFSLDVDIKRAANTLGFDGKRHAEIRDLSSEPGREGEFFSFGPAFNHRGVIKMRGAEVKTTHPQAGHGKAPRPPAPSEKIKGALAELTNLPQQAQEEAKTLADAKRQITDLNRQLKAAGKPAVAKTVEVASKREQLIIKNLSKGLEDAMKIIAQVNASGFEKTSIDPEQIRKAVDAATSQIVKIVEVEMTRRGTEFDKLKREANKVLLGLQKLLASDVTASVDVKHTEPFSVDLSRNESPPKIKGKELLVVADGLTGPQQKVLNSVAFWEGIGVSTPNNAAIALKAGYSSPSSTGYTNPRGELRKIGLVEYPANDVVSLTDEGRKKADFQTNIKTLEDLHSAILGVLAGPERKLLFELITKYPLAVRNEDLAKASNYSSHTSTGYTNPRGQLRKIGLAEYRDGGVAATSILFPEGF